MIWSSARTASVDELALHRLRVTGLVDRAARSPSPRARPTPTGIGSACAPSAARAPAASPSSTSGRRRCSRRRARSFRVRSTRCRGSRPNPASTRCGYDGEVMIDRASMTKLNCRAVPSASGSVYFDVSSRVMNGRSASSIRRSHLTFALPSQPGSSRRSGIALLGTNAARRSARRRSSHRPTPSPPGCCASAPRRPAPRRETTWRRGRAPTSRKIVDSGTPVHSLWLVSPQMSCARDVLFRAARVVARALEEADARRRGKRFRSSSVKIIGRSTMPWIEQRYAFGIDDRHAARDAARSADPPA